MFPSPAQLNARNKSRNGEGLGPRLREGSDEATVNCPDPECNRPTSLSQDGVAGLQSAIHICRLLDILDTLNPQPAKPQCKNCENNDASCYCQKCGHICDACKAVHLGWESHEIITLDQQLTSFWCSKKCFVEGPGLHVAIVEQAATATVYVVDENGREYQRPVEVSCKMSYQQRESDRWHTTVQGRIQDFEIGGSSIHHARNAPARGVWGHAPPERFWDSGLQRSQFGDIIIIVIVSKPRIPCSPEPIPAVLALRNA